MANAGISMVTSKNQRYSVQTAFVIAPSPFSHESIPLLERPSTCRGYAIRKPRVRCSVFFASFFLLLKVNLPTVLMIGKMHVLQSNPIPRSPQHIKDLTDYTLQKSTDTRIDKSFNTVRKNVLIGGKLFCDALMVIKRIAEPRESATAEAVRALRSVYKEHTKLLNEFATDPEETPECRRDSSGLLAQLNKFEMSVLLVTWDMILERMQKQMCRCRRQAWP